MYFLLFFFLFSVIKGSIATCLDMDIIAKEVFLRIRYSCSGLPLCVLQPKYPRHWSLRSQRLIKIAAHTACIKRNSSYQNEIL